MREAEREINRLYGGLKPSHVKQYRKEDRKLMEEIPERVRNKIHFIPLIARSHTRRRVQVPIPVPGISLWLQLYNAESAHWTKTGTDTHP